jgi:hypothetical protein
MSFDLSAILHRLRNTLRELSNEALTLCIFQHLGLIFGHDARDINVENLSGLDPPMAFT